MDEAAVEAIGSREELSKLLTPEATVTAFVKDVSLVLKRFSVFVLALNFCIFGSAVSLKEVVCTRVVPCCNLRAFAPSGEDGTYSSEKISAAVLFMLFPSSWMFNVLLR